MPAKPAQKATKATNAANGGGGSRGAKTRKKEVGMKREREREKNSNFPSIINNVKRHGWGKNMHGPLTLRGARTENGTRCLLALAAWQAATSTSRRPRHQTHIWMLTTQTHTHTLTQKYLSMCVCHFESWARFATKKKLKTLLARFASLVWLLCVFECVCAGAEVEVRVSSKVKLNLANVSALLLPSNCLNC